MSDERQCKQCGRIYDILVQRAACPHNRRDDPPDERPAPSADRFNVAGTMTGDCAESVAGLKLIRDRMSFVAFAEPEYAARIVAALNADRGTRHDQP